LSKDQELLFASELEKFESAGWRRDAINKRAWLEFVEKLRYAVRRTPQRLWVAAAMCELEAEATKEVGLDVELAVGALRQASAGRFPATAVSEQSSEQYAAVGFELGLSRFVVAVTDDGHSNLRALLREANLALASVNESHRFHALGVVGKHLLVAFA
jgi:hypothetical protein